MIPINKRSIGSCIILSLITFGIYSIYWEYLLVKNTRAIKKDDSSCTGEMLCLIFVPFYPLYWWFTRGKLVRDEFSKHGYSASSNETAFLVLALFGLGIVAMAIMQNDFNSLPSESTQSDQRSAKKPKDNAEVSGTKEQLQSTVTSERNKNGFFKAFEFEWNHYFS